MVVAWDKWDELKGDGSKPSRPVAYAATESGYIEFWPVPDKDYEWDYAIDFDLWNNLHEKRMADSKLRWKRSAPANNEPMSDQEAWRIADVLCTFADAANNGLS